MTSRLFLLVVVVLTMTPSAPLFGQRLQPTALGARFQAFRSSGTDGLTIGSATGGQERKCKTAEHVLNGALIGALLLGGAVAIAVVRSSEDGFGGSFYIGVAAAAGAVVGGFIGFLSSPPCPTSFGPGV